MGGTGVEILIAHVSEHPVQGHPMLPLLQTSAEPSMQPLYAGDLDLLLSANT